MLSSILKKFLSQEVIIDVRSPIEYNKGHIPSAKNVPLFSDEARKIVGTTYKKEGRGAAIEVGLKLIDMSQIVSQVKKLNSKKIGIYCFRGGMRSESVGWLLKLLDYDVIPNGIQKSVLG